MPMACATHQHLLLLRGLHRVLIVERDHFHDVDIVIGCTNRSQRHQARNHLSTNSGETYWATWPYKLCRSHPGLSYQESGTSQPSSHHWYSHADLRNCCCCSSIWPGCSGWYFNRPHSTWKRWKQQKLISHYLFISIMRPPKIKASTLGLSGWHRYLLFVLL